jgi:hypothetical protein
MSRSAFPMLSGPSLLSSPVRLSGCVPAFCLLPLVFIGALCYA